MSNTLKVACLSNILCKHNNIKEYINKSLFNNNGGIIYE